MNKLLIVIRMKIGCNAHTSTLTIETPNRKIRLHVRRSYVKTSRRDTFHGMNCFAEVRRRGSRLELEDRSWKLVLGRQTPVAWPEYLASICVQVPAVFANVNMDGAHSRVIL